VLGEPCTKKLEQEPCDATCFCLHPVGSPLYEVCVIRCPDFVCSYFVRPDFVCTQRITSFSFRVDFSWQSCSCLRNVRNPAKFEKSKANRKRICNFLL